MLIRQLQVTKEVGRLPAGVLPTAGQVHVAVDRLLHHVKQVLGPLRRLQQVDEQLVAPQLVRDVDDALEPELAAHTQARRLGGRRQAPGNRMRADVRRLEFARSASLLSARTGEYGWPLASSKDTSLPKSAGMSASP